MESIPVVVTVPLLGSDERGLDEFDESPTMGGKRRGGEAYGPDSSPGPVANLGTRMVATVTEVTTNSLKSSLTEITQSLDHVLASMYELGTFEVSEVSVTVQISAEGKLALIGEVGLSGSGGIELTFKPKKGKGFDREVS